MFRRFSALKTRIRSLGVISVGIGCVGSLAWCFQQTKEKGILSTSSLKQRENETGIFKNAVKCETNKQKSLKDINHISDQTAGTCKCFGHTKHGANLVLSSTIENARNIVKQKKEECGAPGIAVAVSVDGRVVWSEGFGYSDVENNVKCAPETVFRIASISKPLTATLVAQLWEQKKLDLDAPVQKYVPSFPEKLHGGAKVTLTTRHLLSHLGGIRHYNKKKKNEDRQQNIARECREPEKKSEEANSNTKKLDSNKNDSRNGKPINGEKSSTEVEEKEKKGEFLLQEYLIKDHYKSVTEALALFKDDPLTSEPGTKYLYTTFGWTLISAVIEGVTKKDFLKSMKKFFKEVGMENTVEEQNKNIIYNRSRNYQRNQSGHLINAPYVDNSYKWAGGGFLSTVGDLIKFGNAMLYASQVEHAQEENESGTSHLLPGILQSSTVNEMWKVVPQTSLNSDSGYGLGWAVQPEVHRFGSCRHTRKLIAHSGGAIGASSVLVIKPHEQTKLLKRCPLHDQDNVMNDQSHDTGLPPQGIIVAILVNMQGVRLSKTALALIDCFEELKS